MVDLGDFNEVMRTNIWKIILLGGLIIAGNQLFKKLGKRNKKRKLA